MKTKGLVVGLILAALVTGAFIFWSGSSSMSAVEVAMDRKVVGNLTAARSAVSIFKLDHHGEAPASPDQLFPKYIPPPNAELWGHAGDPHPATREWVVYADRVINDTGKWAYVHNPESPQNGAVYVDCSHPTSQGKPWSEF